MPTSTQKTIATLNVVEILPLPEEAVNMIAVRTDTGKIFIGYDPEDIIPDAGTTRTFRGQASAPKATDTVASPGTGARGFTLLGNLWHQFYVGRRAQTQQQSAHKIVKNLLG